VSGRPGVVRCGEDDTVHRSLLAGKCPRHGVTLVLPIAWCKQAISSSAAESWTGARRKAPAFARPTFNAR
jgi:hypothetical protein